jgi:L-2-hydroxyglutarate oxidase
VANHTPTYDVLIAGAGIVGLATAWQLRLKRPDLSIAVLEKESRPAVHQSSRNSGVIHSGVYYEPGSAKAENCQKGYGMMLEFADTYEVPYRICGKLITAVEESELGVLKSIYDKGVANGLAGLEMLDAKTSRDAEPHLRALQSIWVPQAGIIDYGGVCERLAKLLQEHSVNLYYDHQIIDYRRELHHTVLTSTYGDFHAGLFINCCGLYADKVAVLTGMIGAFKIMPFRGEFYKLNELSRRLVKNMIYPVPDPRFPFLGVHFTPRLDGGVEAGPNAVLAFAREGYHFGSVDIAESAEILAYAGFYRMAFKYWRKGWQEMYRSISRAAFLRSAQHLIPELKSGDISRSRSGVRAQCVGSDGKMIYDYLILEDEKVINLVNAPSPAATSAFSIGSFLADKAIEKLNA